MLALAGMGWCGCGVSTGNEYHRRQSTVFDALDLPVRARG